MPLIQSILFSVIAITAVLITSCECAPQAKVSDSSSSTMSAEGLQCFIAHIEPSDQYSIKFKTSNMDFPLYRSRVPLVKQSDFTAAKKHVAMDDYMIAEFFLTAQAKERYRDHESEIANNYFVWMVGNRILSVTKIFGMVGKPSIMYESNEPVAIEIDKLINEINSQKSSS